MTRGFSDRDLWSLDVTISKFCLPRLKRYKEIKKEIISNIPQENFDEILDKIIYSFDKIINQFELDMNKKEYNKTEEGLILFVNNFYKIWRKL